MCARGAARGKQGAASVRLTGHSMAAIAERYVPAHVQDAVAAAKARERNGEEGYRPLPTYTSSPCKRGVCRAWTRLWLRLTGAGIGAWGEPRPFVSAQTMAVFAATAALVFAAYTESMALGLLALALTPLVLLMLELCIWACLRTLYGFLKDPRRILKWQRRVDMCFSSRCGRLCARCADCCCKLTGPGQPKRLRGRT